MEGGLILNETQIIIRGGGDLATGVIQKFYRSGFNALVLEVEKPTAIRRTVALSDAVYHDESAVEDMCCRHITDLSQVTECYQAGLIPLIVDPNGHSIEILKPPAVIDAILAKKNLGTHRAMSPITIALGPGFTAGEDVDAVIETVRGHNLGRLILDGTALPNTGIPGEIGGKSAERVIHAPASGKVRLHHDIGDIVEKDEAILEVGGEEARSPFTGLLRGLIHEGLEVPKGMKVADVDPRTDVDWHTISDKARCLGGAALEAYFYLLHQQNRKDVLL